MKVKLVCTVILTSLLIFTGCSDNEDNVQESELITQGSISSMSSSESRGSSIDQTFPQAQAEVLATFNEIGQSITLGAGHGYDGEYMDQLISFHAYGPKFTEFNEGQLFDSAGNEHNERTFFGETVDEDGVLQFGAVPGTLKVAVYYGNVANLTFISDFVLMIGGAEYTVNNLITLLFVKTKGEWKMVHEHHSPSN